MVLDALAQQVVNGLVVGMVFVLLAAGLSIIFGVMDVINFTHGELFALGAYFAFAVASTSWGGFWVALVLAPLGVALVGGAIERFTIRPLYGRNPLYHILLTFGLVLIFKDVIDFVWGTSRKFYQTPELLSGQPFQVAGLFVGKYDAFVIVGGALVAGVSYLLLERTRFGLIVRAGSMDREMVRHLGIDIDRYYTLVFAFGAALAGLAGVVLAGRNGLQLAMGDSVIVPAFVVDGVDGLADAGLADDRPEDVLAAVAGLDDVDVVDELDRPVGFEREALVELEFLARQLHVDRLAGRQRGVDRVDVDEHRGVLAGRDLRRAHERRVVAAQPGQVDRPGVDPDGLPAGPLAVLVVGPVTVLGV